MTESVGDTPVVPNDASTPEAPVAAAPERTFTQEHIDKIIKHRLEDEKRKHFGDYDDLKAAAQRLSEMEEANKSELERERDARARAEERVAAIEERAAAVEAEARGAKLKAAILAEAAKPDRRVVDPDLVTQLLGPDVEIDADGNPTNVAKAMDSLLALRPYLVAANGTTRGSADQGARPTGTNQLGEEALKTMAPEEIDKAHREGRFADLLGAKR